MGNSKALIRRYEDDLYVSGVGIMIMGVWTVVKIIMELFLGSDFDFNLEAEDPRLRIVAIIVIGLILAILMFLILKLHLYIGLNAVRVAKGKKFKKGYCTAAKIMLVLTILGMGTYTSMFDKPESIDTQLASMLVDLTTIYIFVILIISTNKLNKLKEGQDQE